MIAFFKRQLRKVIEQKSGVADMAIPDRNLASLRPSDQFIVSYPRSGNTWMRYLLSDLIVLGQSQVPQDERGGRLIPDIHLDLLDQSPNADFGKPGRLIKSHNISSLQGRRMVYIFRRPADALISYYHFHLRHQNVPWFAAEGPDKFCEAMIGGWCEHVDTALRFHTERPAEIRFVAYEAMLEQPKDMLRSTAAFLGLPTDEAMLDSAVAHNEFSQLRGREEKKVQNDKEYFFRKGRAGTGEEELAPATLEQIGRLGTAAYERVRSLAMAVSRSE